MNKKEAKKIQKQINSMITLLESLEIRPCKGDNDIRQKEIEIADLRDQIHLLKNEQDGYLYGFRKKTHDDQI